MGEAEMLAARKFGRDLSMPRRLPPHPNLLPRGEGTRFVAQVMGESVLSPIQPRVYERSGERVSLALRERAGVRGNGAGRTEATTESLTRSAKSQGPVLLPIRNVEEPILMI